MDATEEPKAYQGSCHCGAFVFEVRTPGDLKSAIGCNCSSCTKKAYVWLFLPDSAVTVIRDDGLLREFVCGPHRSTHKFCSVCGTSVMAVNPEYRPGLAVNARTLQGLSIWDLDVVVHDGVKINPQWIPPIYSGEEPALEMEGGQIYHGSCRCGDVQIAVKLRHALGVNNALESTSVSGREEQLVECNCSICQRTGSISITLPPSQTRLQNAQNLTAYNPGTSHIYKTLFCKTCGVHIYTETDPAAHPEQVKVQELENEARRADQAENVNVSINIRCFNDLEVDLLNLKTNKVDRQEGSVLNP
ncbi:Mss4-like protein [Echria macrotheca]|uniref:Mss4-like protein n=1 Tax=Echria macrotheca TaxID=438768 RepID=A0AAJ0FF01_9PEZI|nr:Mss4-like protein [Echria macrotheca]